MKRLVCICLCMLLILAGCQSAPPSSTFRVDKVRDIKGNTSLEKYSRYYEEYTDKLIAADNYGELVPYIGRMLTNKESDWDYEDARYGLCTLDGRIVTDAVYDYIYTVSLGTQSFYILQSVPTIEEVEKYIASDYSSEYDIFSLKVTLAKTDGSKVVDLDSNAYVSTIGKDTKNGRIAVYTSEFYEEPEYTYNIKASLYDSDLNLVTEIDGLSNYGGNWGETPIDIIKSDGTLYYADIDGNEVISGENFETIEPFYNGLAAVKDIKTGLYGYINANGSYVIDPAFDTGEVFMENGCTVVQKDGKWFIIDRSGKNVLDKEYTDYISICADRNIYRTQGSIYWRIDTGEPVECPVCGESSRQRHIDEGYNSFQPSTDNDMFFTHYNCTDGFTVFDTKGNVIEHIQFDSEGASVSTNGFTDEYLFVYVPRDVWQDSQFIIFDRKTKKAVEMFDSMYSATEVLNGSILMYHYYNWNDGEGVDEDVPYHHYFFEYSPEKGEFVKSYKHFSKEYTGAGDFYTLADDNFSYLYDKNSKLILKIRIGDDD